jgi:hypothetical protein
MCTFHSLVLPAAPSLDAVNALATDILGHSFVEQRNASIERAFAGKARSYVRNDRCDCGEEFARGSAQAPRGSDGRARKARAGWSQAKIERWYAQRIAARHETSERDAAARWRELVGRMLDGRLAPWVGVLTHVYQGSVSDEVVVAAPARHFAGVTVECFARIEYDVPYVFAPARR